jgi:hypothetical protein
MDAARTDDTSGTEILPGLAHAVQTLDELHACYLPAVAAHIWRACCWPERMAGGWKLGDYRFVVFSLTPERDTNLYVQFWSEPNEAVLAEVCSGEWSPGSVKYVQAAQRELIASLGYAIGGEASNFQKECHIDGVAAAEDAARETLRILYEAFGFRGQWPLEVHAERGERAEERYVHESLTPEDFEKLLLEIGCTPILTEDAGGPVLLAHRGRLRFTARFARRVPKNNLYRLVLLDTLLPAAGDLTDPVVMALTSRCPGITVLRSEPREARLSMALRLDGGVTAEWLAGAVEEWAVAVARCRKLLGGGRRKDAGPERSRQVH